ncbi:MAG: cyclase family protein [Bradymonadales bacterium]|jgi:arylformamidase
MKYYDISRSISPQMAVYKNYENKRPSSKTEADFDTRGFFENSFCSNLHTGTHIDAPAHMIKGGDSIDKIDLNHFYGKAKVFDLTDVQGAIYRKDIEKLDIKKGDIVLFKTRNSFVEEFDPEFVYIEEDAAQYLVDLGIKTVGIDAMSIERGKAHHPTHDIILGAKIAVIEDIRLREVAEGLYILTALPLKLEGLEASFTRAVLWELTTD